MSKSSSATSVRAGMEPLFRLNTSWKLGPFVGMKIGAVEGLVFDFQIGYSYVWDQAEAPQNESIQKNSHIMLMNMNLGWGF